MGRYDAENGGTFGAWSADCTSTAALQGEQTLRNPLFYPTIDSVGHYLNAPRRCCPRSATATTWRRTARTSHPASSATSESSPCPRASDGGTPRTSSYPLVAFHFAGDDAAEPFHALLRGPRRRPGPPPLLRPSGAAKPSANASPPLRIAPHESRRSLRPGPEPPTSARSSASTRAGAWCGPHSAKLTTTTRRRGRKAVSSNRLRKTTYDTTKNTGRRPIREVRGLPLRQALLKLLDCGFIDARLRTARPSATRWSASNARDAPLRSLRGHSRNPSAVLTRRCAPFFTTLTNIES